MASAEVTPPTQSQPLFWNHVLQWFRSIPRAALLSMIGPSLIMLLCYFGWRFYGAKHFDLKFHGIAKDNIVITTPPTWLKSSVVEQVFDGSGLGNVSLLDGQAPAVIARAFDAHPAVRRTNRVEPRSGNMVFIDVEYRIPVAMVCCQPQESDPNGREKFLPIDGDGVLLPTQEFTKNDVLNYIWIYAAGVHESLDRKVGSQFGDPRIADAARLCMLLSPHKERTNIERVYINRSPTSGPASVWLEIETSANSGPRILWGSPPGKEGMQEPTYKSKLTRLLDAASDRAQWSKKELDLTKSP